MTYFGSYEPLHTDITIKVPENPIAKESLFTKNTAEQVIPFPQEIAGGEVSSIRFHRELGLIDTRVEHSREEFTGSLHSPNNPLKFTFVLSSGTTPVKIDGEKGQFGVSGGESPILFVPSSMENRVPTGYSLHNLCIVGELSFIERHLAELHGSIPPGLRRVLDGVQIPYVDPGSITPHMHMVIEQMLNCPYGHSLRRLFLEGKVIELIALRLMQLLDKPASGQGQLLGRLSRRDIDRIHEVRNILLEDIADPPSIHELARRAGINTKKMKYGFREVFGTTVFAYLRDVRLTTARKMLQDDVFSVSEAAQYVGYNSLSHFTQIFREEFGFNPSLLTRKQ